MDLPNNHVGKFATRYWYISFLHPISSSFLNTANLFISSMENAKTLYTAICSLVILTGNSIFTNTKIPLTMKFISGLGKFSIFIEIHGFR
jgi:hypothetical protein